MPLARLGRGAVCLSHIDATSKRTKPGIQTGFPLCQAAVLHVYYG